MIRHRPASFIDEAGNVVAIEQEEDADDGGEDDFDTRFAEFERLSGARSW